MNISKSDGLALIAHIWLVGSIVTDNLWKSAVMLIFGLVIAGIAYFGGDERWRR